ncbi:MAG: polyprenyl synthetase family protein [Thermodesulfovibrionales bacterium]|nr:polyprenyl synthetase family protein [Thermodesulfovibrionales bacterium]
MNPREIFSAYSTELDAVERQLLAIFQSDVFLIPMIGKHIVSSGGKRMRPLFLLLSADLCGYKGSKRIVLAAIIEAIHTASLLHDDVIDGAKTRRGKPSSNALWGNQVVVLVGDFLYSNALKLAVEQKNQRIMETLSDATTKMTEGEILQLHKIADPSITENEYLKIISAKTGVLISAACQIGCLLADRPDNYVKALGNFGMKTGIAFQMADDILDYMAKEDDLGKKLGKDLEEGKITMPLIQLLKVVNDQEKMELLEIIESISKKFKNSKINKKYKRIINLFKKYEIINESLKIASNIVQEAKSELDIFPPSEHKEAIILMADYSMKREK